LSKSSGRAATDQRMAAVHALGHPSSPAPQTAWEPSEPAQGGGSAVPTVSAAPAAMPPSAPSVPVLAQGIGSDLIVTWTAPPVDPTHSTATSFSLRHGPGGVGTWTVVQGVSSPHELSNLPSDAVIDVQLQATNAGGASVWSAAATLITGSTTSGASCPPTTDRPPQGRHVHGVDPGAIRPAAAARKRSPALRRSSSAPRQMVNCLIRLIRTDLCWLARLLHLRRAG
jgi:hypothetical protein